MDFEFKDQLYPTSRQESDVSRNSYFPKPIHINFKFISQ